MAGGIGRGNVGLYQFAPPDKKRLFVVLARDSAISYLSTVTIAPTTSAIRGVPSETKSRIARAFLQKKRPKDRAGKIV